MALILTKEERDEIVGSLSEEQRNFILNYVKRGKKTVFANELAKDKGIVLPSNISSEELEHLLDEWVLVDYIDNGFVNPETPCECGRPLRYQYIVKHKTTNEARCFGIKHFEEHTEIPAEIVARIKNGFQTIEYEMDELLVKIKSDWNLMQEIPFLPEDFSFSKDMDLHLKNKVPLLDRQIRRLRQQVLTFMNTGESQPHERKRPEINESLLERETESKVKEPVAINLFTEEEMPAPKREKDVSPHALDPQYREAVQRYLKEGVTSARVITELLIKNNGAPRERYTTRKPKLYVAVCFYLDLLVSKAKAKHIGVLELEDRYYTYIGCS
ncbi:DUF3895 domain-containing protein [Evansella tamaricis]|uniref:DUF3895 domain-containing protein n=1 Tax=Evansella tamaricis TaxID=2069301 RepID=A0ABS6JJM0_9BACI|nr:DUF3895 domain-containing protein [Evansella tamaricis]MBU9713862.1 DUF3895 domain-containing protein [Evansella tamaricis]